jgi:hypothetical protein
MKIFISSVVAGLQEFRDEAAHAAQALGHEVRRSEDFPAVAATPQQTCLDGVRWADVILLLLGERYGTVQASGRSATHEEFEEAKERRPVLAFLQAGVIPEEDQVEFIEVVRSWEEGRITGKFSTPDELKDQVTRSLHELELSMQAGEPGEGEMLARANELLPERSETGDPSLALAIASGPRQPILRPSELEDPTVEREVLREALLGTFSIFDTSEGSKSRIEGNRLIVEQPGGASVAVDDLGSVQVTQSAREKSSQGYGLAVLIEEDLRERLGRAISLTALILDRVDPVHRLSHVVPVVALFRASYLGWRTRDEHAKSPNSVHVGWRSANPVITLSPPLRSRAALKHDAERTTDDFIALLRRQIKNR